MFKRLCEVLAQSRNNDLRRQIQFLKAENEILRSLIEGPIRTNRAERDRLIRLGRPLGPAIKEVISIVAPQTFAKWLRLKRPRIRTRKRKRGRPPKPREVRELVVRLARETGWGYTRLVGEMRKLGHRLSKGTIKNILKEAGIPTSPKRDETTWDQFLKAHAKTLWACDFVSKPIWTLRGRVQAFFLVFMHINTRRVVVTRSTTSPDASWVAEQVAAFAETTRTWSERPRMLIRDRDCKFGPTADETLCAGGIKPLRLPPYSPNLNAFVERVIKTIQVECLDRFIVLGTGHLDHLAREFTDYYNRQRPHSRIGYHAPAQPRAPAESVVAINGRVRCQQRLGGVIRHCSARLLDRSRGKGIPHPAVHAPGDSSRFSIKSNKHVSIRIVQIGTTHIASSRGAIIAPLLDDPENDYVAVAVSIHINQPDLKCATDIHFAIIVHVNHLDYGTRYFK